MSHEIIDPNVENFVRSIVTTSISIWSDVIQTKEKCSTWLTFTYRQQLSWLILLLCCAPYNWPLRQLWLQISGGSWKLSLGEGILVCPRPFSNETLNVHGSCVHVIASGKVRSPMICQDHVKWVIFSNEDLVHVAIRLWKIHLKILQIIKFLTTSHKFYSDAVR